VSTDGKCSGEKRAAARNDSRTGYDLPTGENHRRRVSHHRLRHDRLHLPRDLLVPTFRL